MADGLISDGPGTDACCEPVQTLEEALDDAAVGMRHGVQCVRPSGEIARCEPPWV